MKSLLKITRNIVGEEVIELFGNFDDVTAESMADCNPDIVIASNLYETQEDLEKDVKEAALRIIGE